MRLEEVLGYISKEELDQLTISYKVDNQVKKLHGQMMFKLLLFSMLNIKNNRLGVMEEFNHSLAFKSIANTNYKGVEYNSIRDWLVSLNPDYFESIKEFEIDENQTERLLLEKDLEVILCDKRSKKLNSFYV